MGPVEHVAEWNPLPDEWAPFAPPVMKKTGHSSEISNRWHLGQAHRPLLLNFSASALLCFECVCLRTLKVPRPYIYIYIVRDDDKKPPVLDKGTLGPLVSWEIQISVIL